MTNIMTSSELLTAQAKAMKEQGHGGLQELVERACIVRGLEYHHQRISRQSREGWPDLVIALSDVIYVELKTQKNRPTVPQAKWLNILSSRGHRCFLWRPSHWLNGTVDLVLDGARTIGGFGQWTPGRGVIGDKWSLPVEKYGEDDRPERGQFP